ncbi:hypothetical protein [Microbacterium sp. HMWF026]|uniref:hypothetical protein n=1 Tax=Microbacterium sp. HMWF026 TaxID=2056861 RepID=UPI0011B287DF|nr:hypothetical protein [Microbacterium sp. HMWF026]
MLRWTMAASLSTGSVNRLGAGVGAANVTGPPAGEFLPARARFPWGDFKVPFMGSPGRISIDGDVLNDLVRRVDDVRDQAPSEVSTPPPVHDDDLTRAGSDAADALRLSLNAVRADLETLASAVQQTVTLWDERERAMVSLVDDIDAGFGDASPTAGPR